MERYDFTIFAKKALAAGSAWRLLVHAGRHAAAWLEFQREAVACCNDYYTLAARLVVRALAPVFTLNTNT